jgi:hypothetical protein
MSTLSHRTACARSDLILDLEATEDRRRRLDLAGDGPVINSAVLAHYRARAHALRSAAIRHAVKSLGRRVSRLWRSGPAPGAARTRALGL